MKKQIILQLYFKFILCMTRSTYKLASAQNMEPDSPIFIKFKPSTSCSTPCLTTLLNQKV